MTEHAIPRRTHTTLPDDGVFRFVVQIRMEGKHGGHRITIPAPIARGLAQVKASRVSVEMTGLIANQPDRGAFTIDFVATLRHPNPRQTVVGVPAEAKATDGPFRVCEGLEVVVEMVPLVEATTT